MAWKKCPECDQPMLPKGRVKKPGEFDHAQGCPIGKRERGLYRKYQVQRADGRDAPGEEHADCHYYVLDLACDPFAAPALRAYADACEAEYPDLASDLRKEADAAPKPRGAR